MDTKALAWLSRHAPTKAQRKALEAAGYRICQAHPADRFHGGADMFAHAQMVCGGLPAVIIAIAPKNERWLGSLIQRAGDCGIPVVQPVNVYADGAFVWTGRWKQLITISQEWTP
jgi:hypothetical protein